ncbi:MAG: hypothetical protein U0792_13560 [Gemmataceae bacterium]
MAKKNDKEKKHIVAFKVEDDLADFLDKLPNKSEFIRKAILAQFGMTCPLCSGTGVVDKGIHDHFVPVIDVNLKRPCEKCKTQVAFPISVESAPPADRERFRQFLHGGPLYCSKCYPSRPSLSRLWLARDDGERRRALQEGNSH